MIPPDSARAAVSVSLNRNQRLLLGVLPLASVAVAIYWNGAQQRVALRIVAGLCMIGVAVLLSFVEDGRYPEEWTRDEEDSVDD